jgi:general secretion pathway protein A
MYLEFYKLREKPFSLTPDPSFLYNSQTHKKAIAFLRYGLQESKGFLQLTGPVGSGKTTLLRAILSQLDERTRTAYIFNPSAPFPHLLRSIMKDLEIPNIPPTREKLELLDFFHEYLLVQARRSNPVVIIIDEAQNLGVKNLEEIRMLSNFETTKEKLIQIVFVGQPELIKILDLPELRQLKQRIQVCYHLAPLKASEVKGYIEHRLKVAGSDGELKFTDDACEAIYQFSEGIPRLINSVCDVALLIGYVNERKTIDLTAINEATGEINGSFENEAESEVPVEVEEPIPQAIPTEYRESGTPHSGLPDGGSASPLDHDGQEKEAARPLRGEAQRDNVAVIQSDLDTEKENAEESKLSDPLSEQRAASSFLPQAGQEEKIEKEDSPSRPECIVQAPAGEESRKDKCPETQPDEQGLHAEIAPMKDSVPDTLETATTRKTRFIMKLKKLLGYILSEDSAVQAADSRVREDAPPEESMGSAQVGQRRPKLSDPNQAAPQIDLLVLHLYNGLKHLLRLIVFWKIRRIPQEYLLLKNGDGVPEGFINSKLMILLKGAGFTRGTAEDLNLDEKGFHFIPLEKKEGERQYLLYEGIIAAKLLDNFDEPWRKSFDVSGKPPKGRQVVVTLLNGEVIEGISLDRLEPENERFFLISPNGAGNPSWMLVEKSGAAGILTERFKTGIYAEQFLGLPQTVLEEEGVPIDPHEAIGDSLFSLKDYKSAVAEYEQIPHAGILPDRVHLKIALCHFNRSIQHLHGNRYIDARRESILAAVHRQLTARAVAQIETIDRLLHDGRDPLSTTGPITIEKRV